MFNKIMDILMMEKQVIICEDYESAAATAAMLVDVFGDSTTYRMNSQYWQKDGRFIFEVDLPRKYIKRFNRVFKDCGPKELTKTGAA